MLILAPMEGRETRLPFTSKDTLMIRTFSKTSPMASLGFLVSASLMLAAESGYRHAQDPDVYPTVITGRL